jgi:hypothetical protein
MGPIAPIAPNWLKIAHRSSCAHLLPLTTPASGGSGASGDHTQETTVSPGVTTAPGVV